METIKITKTKIKKRKERGGQIIGHHSKPSLKRKGSRERGKRRAAQPWLPHRDVATHHHGGGPVVGRTRRGSHCEGGGVTARQGEERRPQRGHAAAGGGGRRKGVGLFFPFWFLTLLFLFFSLLRFGFWSLLIFVHSDKWWRRKEEEKKRWPWWRWWRRGGAAGGRGWRPSLFLWSLTSLFFSFNVKFSLGYVVLLLMHFFHITFPLHYRDMRMKSNQKRKSALVFWNRRKKTNLSGKGGITTRSSSVNTRIRTQPLAASESYLTRVPPHLL